MESLGDWDFDYSGDTSCGIGTECSSVSNDEAVRRFDLNFEFESIDFSHTFHFSECHNISVTKSVPLVIM